VYVGLFRVYIEVKMNIYRYKLLLRRCSSSRRARLSGYRVLLRVCRAVLSVCRTLLSVYRSMYAYVQVQVCIVFEEVQQRMYGSYIRLVCME